MNDNINNSDYRDYLIISQRLEELITDEDRNTLEAEINSHTDMINDIGDKELFRKHVIACIMIEEYDLALQSLKKINNYYPGADELAAMIHYTIGEYDKAANFFDNIQIYLKPKISLLFKAISDWECGNNNIKYHEQTLNKILDKSAEANNFIGTLYYNKGDYISASDYYIQEVLKSNYNELARFNALRALYQIDENEAEKELPKFYVETGSHLSIERIRKEFSKKELDITHFYADSLHEIAKKLL